jgi:hypothetical protein
MDLIAVLDSSRNKHLHRQSQIAVALSTSQSQLTLREFVDETKYELSDAMELDFITWIEFDLQVVLTKEIISSFGYNGALNKQKEHLLRTANNSNIPYVVMGYPQYDKFRRDFLANGIGNTILANNIRSYLNRYSVDVNVIFPQIRKPRKDITVILIKSKDLLDLIMVANTTGCRRLKNIYISSLKLLSLYHEYCALFRERVLEA